MTQLAALPLVNVTMRIGTNEDWLDSIQFLDGDSDPIPLSGITFASVLRAEAANPVAYLPVSNAPSFNGLPSVGLFVIGGTGDSVLSWYVAKGEVGKVPPGLYEIDVVGAADGRQRRIIYGTIEVVCGVTR